MKRDMDLVRKILLAMEADEPLFSPANLTFAGCDQSVIARHVWLMEQGGLVAAVNHGPGPVARPAWITPKGQAFLTAVRDDAVWFKVKAAQRYMGLTLPFTMLQELALKIPAFAPAAM
jgi:hypothetical protein